MTKTLSAKKLSLPPRFSLPGAEVLLTAMIQEYRTNKVFAKNKNTYVP